MKPTKAINVTGRADWQYKPAAGTDVADTMKEWLKRYKRAWDEAHAENAERDDRREREISLERISRVRNIR